MIISPNHLKSEDRIKTTDILIIGAGQSGVALGHQLHKRRYRFLLVEATPRVGDNWRNRYDSLVLFTTNELSSLPDFPIPGDPESYTSHNDFGDYLEAYARYFEMPVELNTRIQKLERVNDEFYATSTSFDELLATDDRVIVMWTFQGTDRQGTQVRWQGINIDRFVDGKIVERWVLWDRLGFFQQVGVVPRTEDLLQKVGM